MLGKIILWVSGLIFTSYGVACLLSPELPAGYAGLTITNGDAYAEMGAMYGGLQTGFGLFCILAAIRPELHRAGLLILVFVIGALAVSRLFFAFTTTDPVGVYTWGAMGYEFTTALLSAVALRRN